MGIQSALRVAIIGAGPSGFYAAEYLQKQVENVQIDMFDRLPTPYGLVRGGVAPDHAKIKSVTKIYHRIATQPNFRFLGHVTLGKDVTVEDLKARYHAIIYAMGAQTDRSLGIPGEDLPGSYAATEFVGWYNAHPDYCDYDFQLDQVKRVAVIGVGNVAMDVTRILAKSVGELADTDIADYALDALAKSTVQEVYVFGRRGAAQAAFTNPEIKELGELELADCVVDPQELELDQHSQAFIDSGEDRKATRNVTILRDFSERTSDGKPRQIILRFLQSPLEVLGDEKVEAIKMVKNELYLNDQGVLRPRATEETETIPIDLVFRSVGYRGVPVPDVPFYDRWGIIPNIDGRVVTEHGSNEVQTGEYVVGWIKRGPSGVIGTNKPDSIATVKCLLEDWEADRLRQPNTQDDIHELLAQRGTRAVSFADWERIDAAEQRAGEAQGRPRVKFAQIDAMLDVLDD